MPLKLAGGGEWDAPPLQFNTNIFKTVGAIHESPLQYMTNAYFFLDVFHCKRNAHFIKVYRENFYIYNIADL